MRQATAGKQTDGGEPNPVDSAGLCLLSLDGGGVRGLSTLYILKGIMTRLNDERQALGLPTVKPCEVFDLIGGTSTGGLIAIMLGRLEMDVDACISAFVELMESVFARESGQLPPGLSGRINTHFDSKKLESAVEQVIVRSGASITDLFNVGKPRGCRVFVCAAAKEVYGITRLRSYDLPKKSGIRATILDAALATSAAAGFFEPVSVGELHFVDGALGANNPVEQVEREASDIWCADTAQLMPLVKCFVSVGTGYLGKKAIQDNMLKLLSRTLAAITTETQETEESFISRWRQHYDLKRYFRFDVDHGLEDVGLEEYKEQGTIEAATESYLNHPTQVFRVRDCVLNLKQMQKPREPCWTVPFEKNVGFIGHGLLLDKLEAALFAKDRPSKIALFGLPGVGKTQVALELAHRTRARDPQCSVMWIPTDNIESLRQAYLDAAQQLGIPVTDDEDDVKRLVQHHLGQDSAGQWLVIYDNADDLDMWVEGAGDHDGPRDLIEYVPWSSQGCVVFTTRSSKVAVRLVPQGIREEVSEIDKDIAIDLLLHTVDRESPDNRDDAGKLVNELARLPLAIVQAASYIHVKGISIADYLSLLGEQEEDDIKLLSEDFEDDGRYRTGRNPVLTTWLISFKQIRRTGSPAADYLSLMSCFDPTGIPLSLLPPEQSRTSQVNAIGTLSAYSFVMRRSATEFLDMHRLVHLAVRNWLRREKSLDMWTNMAVSRLAKVSLSCNHENRSLWRMYLPHARFILGSCLSGPAGEREVSLLWKLGMCVLRDGQSDEAENFFSAVMEIFNKIPGTVHLNTLTSMTNLASRCTNQGRWKEAELLELQVIRTSKRVLGTEHPNTLTSMANLASIYRHQGRLEEAEHLEVEGIKTSEKVLGAEHPNTLTSMANLASTYRHQGRWKEAEHLEVKVVKISQKVLGAEHPNTLTSMANLASIYRYQGRLEEAEHLEVGVIKTSKKVLGAEHPNTLKSMANLALTYQHQGQLEEAEHLEMGVTKTSKKVLGAEHPNTLRSMANLASIYQQQGRRKEAEHLELQLTEINKRVIGTKYRNMSKSVPNPATREKVSKSIANKASIHRHQPRLKKAKNLFTEVTRDDSDNETLDSIDFMLPESGHICLRKFAEQLAGDIHKFSSLSQIPKGFNKFLPGLLKTFARKLHGESSRTTQREVSVFLHKYRRNIVEFLDSILLAEPSEQGSDDQYHEKSDSQPFLEPGSIIPLVSSVKNTDALGDPGISGNLEAPGIVRKDHKDLDSLQQFQPFPNLTDHQQFIQESRAYQWLLSMIKVHAQLDTSKPSVMFHIGESIRDQVLAHAPFRKSGYHRAPACIEMSFCLDWNPLLFIQEQEYSVPAVQVLDHIICLTGTWKQAQAVTTSEYMEQTWPLSNEPIRLLLKKFLSLSGANTCDYELPCGSLLRYTQQPSSCLIVAVGQVDFVSEIGEQLGWLGSALRSSLSDGVAACSPELSDLHIRTEQAHTADAAIVASCQIDFPMVDNRMNSLSPGFCWANLFRNPVLVTGYPIPRRADPETGLELSLGVMTELVQSWQVVSLGERIILKGFCSLLVATAVVGDAVIWHFLFNPDGERISYCDARLEDIEYGTSQKLVLRELGTRRHIVGWCCNVKEYSGHPEATLAIESSRLPPPGDSIVIDKLYIEGGSGCVGGLMASLGKKDKPIYLRRDKSYVGLLDWVSFQPVVFYDVDDQRAWLVDGASALLHLVRASIDRDRMKPVYLSRWKFSGTLDGDSPPRGGRIAAIQVLENVDNLNLKLYLDDKRPNETGQLVETFYYFRNRVQAVLHYLEALIDYQAQDAAQDGYRFRLKPNMLMKSVVGFDFWDVAKPVGPIRQRAYSLRTVGHGWVDYIRSIKATTIFGNKFGELIQAENPDLLCPNWKTVPTGMDYMSTSIATLKILQNAKEAALDPGEITSHITWSSHCELFSQCGCLTLQPGDQVLHLNPVQLLLPKGQKVLLDVPKMCMNITLNNLGDHGAVVFSHAPYRIGPRKREDKSGDQKECEAGGISSAGSSRGQGTLSPSTENNTGSSIPSTTTTQTTQPTTGSVASGDNGSNQGSLRDKGKRPWSWVKVLRSKE